MMRRRPRSQRARWDPDISVRVENGGFAQTVWLVRGGLQNRGTGGLGAGGGDIGVGIIKAQFNPGAAGRVFRQKAQ